MTDKPVIDVAVGLILNSKGELLLGNRPDDKPWPGWWELPGGKIEAGETVLDALHRELDEELGIHVTEVTPWVHYQHEYPKTRVNLAFCRVTGWEGTATGREGQQLAWVDPTQPITVGQVLPATEPPLRWLQFASHYLLSSIGDAQGLDAWLSRLEHALKAGIKLVQFREPQWEAAAQNEAERTLLKNALLQTLRLCHQFNAQCLVNSVHPREWWQLADGVQLRATDAKQAAARVSAPLAAHIPHADPVLDLAENALVGVSVHSEQELQAAIALNASFVVIGHVLPTPSHPHDPALGWERFQQLAQLAGRPAFAIGGQSEQTLQQAKLASAHGIAGIRHLVSAS